ncbi:MAG: beta-galactosidase [Clostridia bacterium]|nr:beta-galactosidase [Clostridia bacterium]
MYRTEHPKPQFQRNSWRNLNGIWEFRFDPARSGRQTGLYEPEAIFPLKINVPFCPESALSGIEEKDFHHAVWYRRSVSLSGEELKGRVRLHFGAVDYDAFVYVNGKRVGTHRGGYTSFYFDITDHVQEGENTLVVCAEDDTRDPLIPSGKQSDRFHSYGCSYTRTTGIWQTVWLEFLPEAHIESVRYLTDVTACTLTVRAKVAGEGTLCIRALYNERCVGEATAEGQDGDELILTLPLSEKHLWEPGHGRLYSLSLSYGEDSVESYFGLRSIRLSERDFLINDKKVFQRLVLDQGFYPDGIYTAPSDKELAADIERSLAMGFNGARLHEKVFEERFLYHCDRLGYLVWGEFANWGLDHSREDALFSFLPQWLEAVERDRNHPAIIGWCPFNETWDINGRQQRNELLSCVYLATRAADPSRPCIDTSGNYHVITDVYDLHDYEQDPAVFREHYEPLGKTDDLRFAQVFRDRQIRYDGKRPFFVSEYGGIKWSEEQGSWGYGNAPKSEEEFLTRLKGLTDVLLDNEHMFGYCYTQLTDVEQEQNGLYTYDRRPKFDPAVIAAILGRKAKYEEE